jgi:excisionase family DNA binding protein
MSTHHIDSTIAKHISVQGAGVTAHEIAARFRVTAPSVRRWARQGIVPAFKVGGTYRFDLTAVEEALRVRGEASDG